MLGTTARNRITASSSYAWLPTRSGSVSSCSAHTNQNRAWADQNGSSVVWKQRVHQTCPDLVIGGTFRSRAESVSGRTKDREDRVGNFVRSVIRLLNKNLAIPMQKFRFGLLTMKTVGDKRGELPSTVTATVCFLFSLYNYALQHR